MPSKITVVRDPVQDINLVNVSASEPTAPLAHGTTYVSSALGRWGDLNVAVNDVITWNAQRNKFVLIRKLQTGDRFIVAGYSASGAVGAGPLAGKDNRIVTFNGGAVADDASWVVTNGNPPVDGTLVEVSNYQSIFALYQFQFDAVSGKWFTDSVSQLADPFGYAPPEPAAGASDLSELKDVELTDPIVNGEVLTYNGTAWVNAIGGGGGGSSDITTTAAETVATGDIVYISAAGAISKAVATGDQSHVAIGAVKTGVASGETATVVTQGVVSGYTGLTPGVLYYLSTTAGAVTPTAPSDEGSYVLPVGVAITPTSLAVNVLSAVQI